MDMGISALSSLCENAMITFKVNEVIRSLIIDGIFVGVGSVLSFLPIIVVLFFFLSLLRRQWIHGKNCICNGQDI